jgi:hypothetical protein
MPFCGYNPKMIQGLAIFAQGLFEAVLERSEAEHIDIKAAFEHEVSELTSFLGVLEDKYQELRRDRNPKLMTELVEWIGKDSTHSDRSSEKRSSVPNGQRLKT